MVLGVGVHGVEVARNHEGKTHRRIRDLVLVGSRSIGDKNALLLSLILIDGVNANAMLCNDLHIVEVLDDVGRHFVIADDNGVTITCELNHFLVGERTAIRVELNFAASSLKTLDAALIKLAERYRRSGNFPVLTAVILHGVPPIESLVTREADP